MSFVALLLTISMAGEVPDLELDVGVQLKASAATSHRPTSFVHLKCVSRKCAVAVFTQLPLPCTAKSGSQPPAMELFDAATLQVASSGDGWLELRTTQEAWTHEFRFQLRTDKEGRVWLTDFVRTTTLVDFAGVRSVFVYEPIRQDKADVTYPCPMHTQGIPAGGLRVTASGKQAP